MWVVGFPGDLVDVHELGVVQAKYVVDEAGDEVAFEQVAWEHAVEVAVGPGFVVAVGEVGAFEQIRNPADAAFGEGDLQFWKFPEYWGEQPVCGRVGDVHRHVDDPGVDRCVQ